MLAVDDEMKDAIRSAGGIALVAKVIACSEQNVWTKYDHVDEEGEEAVHLDGGPPRHDPVRRLLQVLELVVMHVLFRA